jgi:hypothetical protein
MFRSLFFSVVCVLVYGAIAFAGQAQQQPRPPAALPGGPPKQARALRVQPGAIHLDGRLDEAVWEQAEPVVDFEQAEPNEHAVPTDAMEVRFAYDETALWIGARMHTEKSQGIQAPMSRRDEADQAEYIELEIDTYHDRRTAYMFGVTASGVRLDHFHATDNEADIDANFDPVWQAKTSVGDHEWTAEMWIPFSQLRFNDSPERIWGLNLKRWRPTINEQDYWVVIGRTGTGWSSHFGELRGMEGVSTRARLELLP